MKLVPQLLSFEHFMASFMAIRVKIIETAVDLLFSQ